MKVQVIDKDGNSWVFENQVVIPPLRSKLLLSLPCNNGHHCETYATVYEVAINYERQVATVVVSFFEEAYR